MSKLDELEASARQASMLRWAAQIQGGVLLALVEAVRAADNFVEGMEAQDMGLRLPSSMIPNNPGSYADLLGKYRKARAKLEGGG